MRWDMIVVGGPDMGRTFYVEDGQTVTIGRSSDADIVLDDVKLSRIHCSISVKEGFAVLKDENSRNGTFVNKKKIDSVPLKTGDHIFVGKSVLQAEAVDISDTSIYGKRAIGPFRLISRLGLGGMSIVYLAEKMPEQTKYALKVLKTTVASQKDLLERFHREARAGLALDHPNIVKILEIGRDGNTEYIVMEYCPGDVLSDVLDRDGKITSGRALKIASQVVEAMRHAYRHNVIHRDIKPENIILMKNDFVKVADFGLAKFLDGATAEYLTHTGEGLGTLCYLPPEQIDQAKVADIRADIYSLGATVYDMVAGHAPIDKPNVAEFFKAIRSEVPVSLRKIDKNIPKLLSEIVDKCLVKDPAHRFQTPDELAIAIRAALHEAG
jgi:serine/threonine-protein kinase